VRSFQKVLQIAPTDGPAQVFIKRCETLRAAPLPSDWNGVYKLEEK